MVVENSSYRRLNASVILSIVSRKKPMDISVKCAQKMVGILSSLKKISENLQKLSREELYLVNLALKSRRSELPIYSRDRSR